MAPLKSLRYLIGSCSESPLTEPLCKLIMSNNPENLILGTSSNLNAKTSVRHIVDTTNLEVFTKIILDSDVIIYDLNTCDLNECEFAIKTLKISEKQEDKYLNYKNF
jgi:adenylate kinase